MPSPVLLLQFGGSSSPVNAVVAGVPAGPQNDRHRGRSLSVKSGPRF